MLKAIALASFFFAASAITPPATATQPARAPGKVTAPTAPVPHGFCPPYNC